ncbi:MAG TPA: chloride channel protein [Limnochordia bacterium]
MVQRHRLGDFSSDPRIAQLAFMAAVIGVAGALMAVVLLKLIGIFTNLFFYHRWSTALVPAGAHPLGWGGILVPVVGGLIVGLMARYGSERIRGHGIPEALEAILIGRSLVQPRVAVLKPLSSAISIGSGGPFGAEGPIILTAGAVGSIFGQFFPLSAAERKALLVAGAAAGMSATFAAPFAAILFAVELLLFEWRPRSVIPVATASLVAAVVRIPLLGRGPLFPAATAADLPLGAIGVALLIGLLMGLAAGLLTEGVYAAEDLFHKLPLHWTWWPALGGLAVGIGGYFFPRALGVGYDVLEELAAGQLVGGALIGLMLAKAVIWMIALGSGTSGGVLAPLLIIGGCLGSLVGEWAPFGDPGLWAVVGAAALFSGTTRSPFTGIVFALELTHDLPLMLPLLFACMAATALTVLLLPRSILTEKVARRGHHVFREYAVDPLEILSVRDVMTREVETLRADTQVKELIEALLPDPELAADHERYRRLAKHQGYPVVDDDGRLVGMVTRFDLLEAALTPTSADARVGSLARSRPIVAYPDEPLRRAADRMTAAGIGRLPVVAGPGSREIVGIITRSDLLKGRQRALEEEERRERILALGRSS